MSLRLLVASGAVLCATVAPVGGQPRALPQPPVVRDDRDGARARRPAPGGASAAALVNRLASEYAAAWVRRFPLADVTGAPTDVLFDNSPAALRAWHRQQDAWLARLREVDPAVLRGRPEWSTLGMLREGLEASIGERVCRLELWAVDPTAGTAGGWQGDQMMPALARTQPVGTPAARAAALRRWRTFPRFVDTEIANLREGVRLGYTAPKLQAEAVLRQVDLLLSAPDEQSPFADPARRDTTPAFRAAVRALVRDGITPALRRYREFLATEYLPAAREAVALSAMPNGAACLRARLRRYTTLDLSPAELDSITHARLTVLLAERDRLGRALYGTSDARAIRQRMQQDTSLRFPSHAAGLETARAEVARVGAMLPRWFGRPPAQPLPLVDTLSTVAAAQSNDSFYEAATPQSPARVRLNQGVLDLPAARLAALAPIWHEGVPGHHLQLALQQESTRPHRELRRAYFPIAFVEGWATYAESYLARDMGLVQSGPADVAAANREIGSLMPLLLTTGIHARGWTPAQAFDTLRAYTGVPGATAAGRTPPQVLNAIAAPGRFLAYPLGALVIADLRDRARAALEPSFDIRAFHDLVLEDGAVPLALLREKVERWIAERR